MTGPFSPASRGDAAASGVTTSFGHQRFAVRAGFVALVILAGAAWFGRETLARVAAPRDLLVLAALVIGGALLALSVFLLFVVTPRVTRPAAMLAEVAEAVAGGNLNARTAQDLSTGELRRLAAAIDRMVAELSRVVGAMHTASQETAALATDITSGTDHMAAAAQQMASTSGELSRQSTEMAQTIQDMASDAARLVEVANVLTEGGLEGVDRNKRVRELARENRTRFEESAKALGALEAEVNANAATIGALADASEEIRAFVTFVQKMARQSKLLALNAAMEAARAGEQGQGFAVVAGEVRRLAAGASEAAGRTETLVRAVLDRVADSRASSGRAVGTVGSVMRATVQGLESFAQVEEAVADAEGWVASIESAANRSNGLVKDMTTRLDELARGTEAFAAAMQEVAASSEQQSASTHDIAAAAASLSSAAARLSQLVSSFTLASVTEAELPPPGPTDAEIAEARERRRTVEIGDPTFA